MDDKNPLVIQPRQREALFSPAHEILYGGAAGGGKSYLLRLASIIYSMWVPGLVTYIFRRTFKELVSNHIYTPGGYLEMLKPLLQQKVVTWNRSDYFFMFENGSIIQLAHAQWENDVHQYQGAQIGFLGIDESTHFTEYMVRFLRSRVRLGGLQVPDKYHGLFPRIMYCSNPGGVGHHYFKGGFVDHGKAIWQAPEIDGGMLRQYVPAKLSDNQILVKSDPGYANRLRGLGDTSLVDAMLDGDWDILMEGMFSDVWRPRRQVLRPFAVPKTWRLSRAHDYGESAPGGNLYFAEANGEEFVDGFGRTCWVPRGTLFVVGELYFCNDRFEGLRLPPLEQARRMRHYERDHFPGYKIQPGPADTAIWTKPPASVGMVSNSIHDQYSSAGINFIKADKSPGSRVNGWSLLRQRMSSTLRNEREYPHFYVFSTCAHTIRTLPALQRDDKDIEDIDTNQEDHLADIVRYKVLQMDRQVIEKKVVGT